MLNFGFLTGKYIDGIPSGSRGDTTHWIEKYMRPEVLSGARAFCQQARELSLEPAPLALAWLLRRKGVSSVITGATHPDQLEQNLSALEIEISPQVVRSLTRCF